MKTKRRVLVIGGVILGTVLAASAAVEAWGHGAWFGRPGCGGWFHHGPGSGRNMADFVLKRLDEKAAQLNLTAAQKAKYDELRASLETHFSRATEEHKALRDLFHAEMEKEIPDVAVLADTMKRKAQEVSGTVQRHLDLLTAFYGSLDNNQKKQLANEIRARMADHPRWGDRPASR